MKTEIKRIDSLTHNDTTATKNINDNFQALQAGIEDALSRTGKTPNFMDAELDMNTRRIINVGEAVDDTDAATWGQMKKGIERAEAAADRADNSANRAAQSEANARQYATEARNSRDRAEQAAKDAEQYRDETEELAEQGLKKIGDKTDEGLKQLGDIIDNGVGLLDNTISEGKKELDEVINEGITDINKGKSDIDELVKSGESKIKDATDEGVRKIESATEGYQTVDNMVTELVEGVGADKYPSAQAVLAALQNAGGGDGVVIVTNGKGIAESFDEETLGTDANYVGATRAYEKINLTKWTNELKDGVDYFPIVLLEDDCTWAFKKNCYFYSYNKSIMCEVGYTLGMNHFSQWKMVILIPLTTTRGDIRGITSGQYESYLHSVTVRGNVSFSSWQTFDGGDSNIPEQYKYQCTIQNNIYYKNRDLPLPMVRIDFNAETVLSGKICPTFYWEEVESNKSSRNTLKLTIYATEPFTARGTVYASFNGAGV